MLEQEYVEHLIKTANRIAVTEKEYMTAKRDLEVLKSQHILHNDWEKLMGKKKPTVAEKDAYILVQLEEKIKKVYLEKSRSPAERARLEIV